MIYLLKIFNEINNFDIDADNSKHKIFPINKLNDAWLINDFVMAKTILQKFEENTTIASMNSFQQDTKQILLQNIDNFFQNSPYLADRKSHAEKRKVFSKFYNLLETSTRVGWKKIAMIAYANTFIKNNSIFHSTRAYVLNYILLMLEDHFGYEFSKIKINQNFTFFDFYAKRDHLKNADDMIRCLTNFIDSQGDENLSSYTWPIVGLFVMGYDVLSLTLLHSINEEITDRSVDQIFWQSSSVSLLGTRIVTKPFKIGDLEFKKSDEIYISLNLLNHLYRQNTAFGIGSHACIGKKLSYLIVDNFRSVFNTDTFKDIQLKNTRNFISSFT